MKGKSTFSKDEINKISELIIKKNAADWKEQKKLRAKIRDLGFYASDFKVGGNYTISDFLSVINQMQESETDLNKWIEQYKKLIKGDLPKLNYNEVYKWESIQHFQDHWTDNHDSSSIVDLLKNSFNKENNNLWSGSHYLPYKMLIEFAESDPESISNMFRNLYNEKEPLESRVSFFLAESDRILKETRPDKDISTYQSDRSIMVYLTLRFPDKYYFYKNRMYNDFCEITVLRERPGMGSKNDISILESFIDMCDALRAILEKDEELIEISNNYHRKDIQFNDNHHVLTQDFIYSVTTYLKPTKNTKYTIEELKELFFKYLKNTIPKSARNYMSAIPTVNKVAVEEKVVNASIFEVQSSKKLSGVLEKFKLNAEWIERNSVGNNMFSGSMNHYLSFLTELEKGKNELSETKSVKMESHNQILFGPPGTGKTYSTIDRVVKIIVPNEYKKNNHEHNKIVYDQLYKDKKVLFTTFHQSMSYEDFVEGIKPKMQNDSDSDSEEITYEISPGIFKIACARAAYIAYKENKAPTHVGYGFEDLYEAFIEMTRNQIAEDDFFTCVTKNGKEVEIYRVNKNDSIKARAKGSKATHVAPLTKENILKLYDTFSSIEEIKTLNQVKEAVGVSPRITEFYAVFKSLLEFEKTKFKPSNEEEFIEKEIEDEELVRQYESGLFTNSIRERGIYSTPVVLIIDEINRGNVSAIFGELITLLEEDKRLGQDNEVQLTLPYSKKQFSVPPNLFVVGTMNTADRSVEALDTALRRRFSFIEMLPEPELLKDKKLIDSEISLVTLLSIMNDRIEILVDRDHTIGHAFFMEVVDRKSLQQVFADKVIPLLQEYFYGDYGKMEMVIGNSFFTSNDSKVKFAASSDDGEDYSDTKTYHLKMVASMDPKNFETAIEELINPGAK